MGVIKFLSDVTGLFNWNTDDNPTSELTYMNAVKNWQETEKNLVDTVLWQPTTAYTVGNMVKTPSLPAQYCLVCTTAGTSGANEPTYSSVSVGDSVTDGSVTWMVSGYLLVTGGQVYGNLSRNIDSSTFTIYGGTDNEKGARLTLYGKDTITRQGFFSLSARKSSTDAGKELYGTPDGTLSWAGQPVQTSSDKRLKTDFGDVSADVLEAWGKVNWQQFKYIADKERKGDSCRWHTGLVAQDVQEVCGDEILKYGILCHEVQETTEDSEAVDMWTVRYTEALCMEVIYLRHKIADLESRLQAVENRG